MALNRDQLRQRQTPRNYQSVLLGDGSEVRVRSLTRMEQRAWRMATAGKDGEQDPKKAEFSNDVLLAMCIVDDDGNTAFTADEALRGCFDAWDSGDTQAILRAALDVCGIVRRAPEAAEKN